MEIERAGVLGGGIMGSGIAALFANQGIPVTLFDINEELAQASLAKLTDPKQKIQQLTSGRRIKHITAASVDAYPELLPACDVLVEVVPERLDIKQKVLAAVDEHRKPGSIVATNTSGLSINTIVEGRSDDLRAHFLGTHYFHPVRYMPLVELIPGDDTKPEVVAAYGEWFKGIGKRPVLGRDTPNFIANRIGVYGLLKAMILGEKYRLTIEQVDMITASPLARPKTATFRLADMVGLDTLFHVTRNSYENCPDDEVREELKPHPVIERLVEAGRLGGKTGEGFYKKAGRRKFMALDFESLEYRPATKPRADRIRVAKGYADPGQRIRVMVSGGDDPISSFARELVLATGAYALNRLGEVAGDILTIDNAVKWGFAWDVGPIEALDAIGLPRAAEMMEEARIPVPAPMQEAIAKGGRFYGEDEDFKRTFFVPGQETFQAEPDDPRSLSIARLRKQGRTLRENLNARLVDLGDGVLLCELDAKMVPTMNPVDDFILSMLERGHDEVASGRFQALVIGNQAPNFCAGANLKRVLELAAEGNLGAIDAIAHKLQVLNMRGVHAPYPVVAAPHGMTLGGGLELSLGAQVRVALSELYCGLVEVGVGLVPAGAGCLRLLQLQAARKNLRGRPRGPMQHALAAFDLIGYGKVSTSAEDAVRKGLLPRSDIICFSKDEQLLRAKEVALALLDGFEATPEQPLLLAGQGGYLVMEHTIEGLVRMGQITPHSAAIARVQARILTGGEGASPVVPTSEERVMELEREGFLELVANPLTQARMKHMLKTGKPLFN